MEGHVEDGEESVQLLCCSFQKYLHCSESVVNTTCGYETARFTKSFLDRMSGPLIQVDNNKNNYLKHIYTKIIYFQNILISLGYILSFFITGALPSI